MSESVGHHHRDAGTLAGLFRLSGEPVRADRGSVLFCEDPAIILVGIAPFILLGLLALLVGLKDGHVLVGDHHRPRRLQSPGFGDHRLAAHD